MTRHEEERLIRKIGSRTANFSVGFVKINNKENDANIAGSGTLVTAGSRYAILTADHVISELPSDGTFGLVLPSPDKRSPPSRFEVNADYVQNVTLGTASYSSDGPDLGLVLLGAREREVIQATHIFYNLEERACLRSNPPDKKYGLWALVGMIEEWTSELPPEHGFSRVKRFCGLCGVGVIVSERISGLYDYLHFEAKYSDTYRGPNCYKGISGGGLWQVLLTDNGNELDIEDVLLSGVAFYQSDIKNARRTISCHGRNSVYGVGLETLMRRNVL